MFDQFTADNDLAFEVVFLDADHPELDQTVRQEECVAGGDVTRQIGVVCGDTTAVPLDLLRSDGDGLSVLQLYRLMILERARAHLDPGQILENSHGMAARRGQAPDIFNDAGVGCMVSVGEVEPSHVHSSVDEMVQLLSRLRGRSDGGDDLGLPH